LVAVESIKVKDLEAAESIRVKDLEATENTVKRGRGRPPSGEDYVPVCVILRREQVAWLKDFASDEFMRPANVSLLIRELIDDVFTGYEMVKR